MTIVKILLVVESWTRTGWSKNKEQKLLAILSKDWLLWIGYG